MQIMFMLQVYNMCIMYNVNFYMNRCLFWAFHPELQVWSSTVKFTHTQKKKKQSKGCLLALAMFTNFDFAKNTNLLFNLRFQGFLFMVASHLPTQHFYVLRDLFQNISVSKAAKNHLSLLMYFTHSWQIPYVCEKMKISACLSVFHFICTSV